MKFLILIAGILSYVHAYTQIGEVKFQDATFENGMTYPQVLVANAPDVESRINVNIKEQLKEEEASDFCIGQYGYVQKGLHLQILVFCNCIDYEESKTRFILYNLETGEAVPYSDILGLKRKEATGNFLVEKVKLFLGDNTGLTVELIEKIKKENLDAFNVELTRAGISISLKNFETWGEKTLELTWGELRSFLRVNYI